MSADGPVTITYRDSNDKNADVTSFKIDIEPPTIHDRVTGSTTAAAMTRNSVSFIGTINDGDAGLAADTFQLYVDNDPTTKATTNSRSCQIPVEAVYGKDGKTVPIEFEDGRIYRLRCRDWSRSTVLSKAGKMDGSRRYRRRSCRERLANRSKPTTTPTVRRTVNSADEIEIDFDERAGFDPTFDAFNHAIEFQALVRDLAGNVGFSDSDRCEPAVYQRPWPRRNYGQIAKKARWSKAQRTWCAFSRHRSSWLDEVSTPYIDRWTRPSTGFYRSRR